MEQNTARESDPSVTLEDAQSGARRFVSARTPCLSAGPKYRERDRGGVLLATQIDRSDFVTVGDTVRGALVYVQDPGDGTIPATFRLWKVVDGRPTRAGGAPGTRG